MFKKSIINLILITNYIESNFENNIDAYLNFVKICITNGVTSVQLRDKNLSYKKLLIFGSKLKSLLDKYNTPLIVNDNINLCLDLDAMGVHLGQDDGDILYARKLLGKKKIIGLSTYTTAQIITSNDLPINYIGVGAIYPTQNKLEVNVCGLEGLQNAALLSEHPIVAIGGINDTNVKDVVNKGADGIAVIGALHDAIDKKAMSCNLIRLIRGSSKDV